MTLRRVMSRSRRRLPLLLFLFLGPAYAAETGVSFTVDGQQVRGTFETPEGRTSPPRATVLLLHGFTGNRNELEVAGTGEGVFERTARVLAENGYASLRIDFRGSGDSDGAWPDTTLSRQIRDAVAAIDWLVDHYAVEPEHLAVLGWSQGGLVAAHAVAQRRDVGTLLLWAPVVHPMHSYEDLLGKTVFTQALSADSETPFTATLSWGAQTTLKAAFFKELALYSTSAAVAAYPGPLKVFAGLRDDAVYPQPESSQALLRYHPGAESLSVLDTDHVWGALAGPSVLDEKMLPATLAWLEEHL